MADEDQDQSDGSFNFNDVPDAVQDMGGAFVDAARETDAFGPVVDTGLEFADRLDRVGDALGVLREGYEQATGPSSRLRADQRMFCFNDAGVEG